MRDLTTVGSEVVWNNEGEICFGFLCSIDYYQGICQVYEYKRNCIIIVDHYLLINLIDYWAAKIKLEIQLTEPSFTILTNKQKQRFILNETK